MTYIKRVTMHGFKSFGDRTVSIRLAPGFTCIVGPNGAGKSNVIDALCFCLGRVSKKTMRAKKLQDLIFAGTKTLKASTTATVDVVFDNSQNEFPIESDELIVTRVVKAKGGSKFKLNGKNTTREQILNMLAQGNIDPDGSNQFILQGKIVELTHMNIVDRRKFIETLIGLEKYDKMKEQTFKELEKADRDLGKFEAIFKEVSTQLKKYEKEKNDALRWLDLDQKVKDFNAQLYSIKIEKLRHEEETLEKTIDEISVLIRDLEQNQSRQKEKIDQENLVMGNLEDTLSERNIEKEEIEEGLSSLKSTLSAREAELKNAKDNILKLEERKEKLLTQQESLEEGQTYDSLIEDNQSEIDLIKGDIDSAHQSEDETDAEIKEKELEIADLESEKAALLMEISKFKQDISKFEAEINVTNKSIKKSNKKLEKNQADLAKLKSHEESVEEAINKVQDEIDSLNQQIQDFKLQIEEDQKKQKELEIEITNVEKEKSTVEKRLSDNNADISSIKAEINLHGNNITDLEKKKKELEKEYQRLSGGTGIDEALKKLKEKEKEEKTTHLELKNELEILNDKQKKNEQEKSKLELQRRSLENEINDYKTRLGSIETEMGIAERTLKNDRRDKNSLETSLNQIKEEVEKKQVELIKIEKKEAGNQKRLTVLIEERDKLTENINNSEEEYNRSKEDVVGVMQMLTFLTQDIDVTVGDIKSDIQNASEDSINKSIVNFRGLFDDIMDMIKPIEEIAEESAEMLKEMIGPMMSTVNMFTDGVDESLKAMIDEVKEANDIAVQESTEKFDGLIRDLVDIIENTNISMRKLTMSQASELHQQMDEIVKDIQSYTTNSGENRAEISKYSTLVESKTNELNTLQRNYDDLTIKVDELQEKVEKLTIEEEEKKTLMETAKTKLNDEIAKLELEIKGFTDSFWQNQKKLSQNLDEQAVNVTKVQDDLRELGDIQRYLDDIENTEKDIEKIENEIENKKKKIEQEKKNTEVIQEEINEVQIQIDELKAKRAEFFEIRQGIDKKIEDKIEELKIETDKIRGLQNVQRIITDIANLEADIKESEEKIEENGKEIEVIQGSIEEVDLQVNDKDSLITDLKKEKADLQDKLKELRSSISSFNSDLQEQQQRLSDLTQMKDRSIEIESIEEEVDDTDIAIGEIEVDIEEITESIGITEEKRTLKVEEINKVTSERDKSWENQKLLREELSNINSAISAENANLTTSKAKQETITDRIDENIERSKEFGALPPPPEHETEESLIGKIQKTSSEKKSLEPVNLKAIEYFEEVQERFDEIDMRRQTLQRERKSILDAIDKIELEKTRTFMKAYHEINRHFSKIFQKLSPGGSAKMILERPDKPFEGGITIEARPRGKKISSLEILSGGEKTLVALSFIFAVQTQFPAPFYVLDEIDAALDGPNVHRVSMVIKEFSDQAQFMVISHREENIMNAEMIYGVSQTDGLTSIFSVDLQAEKARIDED